MKAHRTIKKNITFFFICVMVLLGLGGVFFAKRIIQNNTRIHSYPYICEAASSLVDETLLYSLDLRAEVKAPLTRDIRIGKSINIQRKKGEVYTSYTAEIVRIIEVKQNIFPINEAGLQQKFMKHIIPQMQKMGYSLIHTGTFASLWGNDYDPAFNPIGLIYVFKKNNELFQVSIENKNLPKKPQLLDIEYNCAKDIRYEKAKYEQLLTFNEYSAPVTDGELIMLGNIVDNVFIVGQTTLQGGGASTTYLTYRDGKWVKLIQAQVEPPCGVFEKYKVGRGLGCYEQNVGLRKVSY